MKKCTLCKKEKPESDFYIRRSRGKVGYHSRCKECFKADQKDYHHNRGGKEVQKKYRQTEAGQSTFEQAKARYEKSEKGKSTRNSYQQTIIGKRRKRRQLTSEQKAIQRKARNFLNGAIRYGRKRPAREFKCDNCGQKAREYHHYLGYEREHWLDVIPLCIKCHREIDLI